jgi:spore germination protein GerM
MRKNRSVFLAVMVVMAVGVTMVFVGSSATSSRSRFARHDVKVFFTRASALDDDCSMTRGYERRTVGQDVLHDTLNALLRGPRAGERDSASSPFSRKTAGMLNSVRIVEGTAYVDLDDLRTVIPGASSSCGSASLLAELNRTTKQFPTVDRAVYSLEGSVNAFYGWLQMEPPS